MCMIARNERENVAPCFETFWDHVDEVVLCDTGSRDGTIAAAHAFARGRGETDKLIVARFKWCDDFAAARNYAHSLATGDVHATIDLDDRLIGAEHLRDVAHRFASDSRLGAIEAEWRGPITVPSRRPRLWRAGTRWVNRIQERPDFEGKLARTTRHLYWEHTRTRSSRRDLGIALKWVKDEPDNPTALMAVAQEAALREEWEIVSAACVVGLSLADLLPSRRVDFLAYQATAAGAVAAPLAIPGVGGIFGRLCAGILRTPNALHPDGPA